MYKFIFAIFIIGLLVFFVNPVLADDLSDAWAKITEVAGDTGAGYDTDGDDIGSLIGTVIKAALSLLGVVFLVLMIYGGFLWMTDRGNEEQLKRAKNLITAAIIGLIIVVAAYAISYFVIEKITSGMLTTTSTTPDP